MVSRGEIMPLHSSLSNKSKRNSDSKKKKKERRAFFKYLEAKQHALEKPMVQRCSFKEIFKKNTLNALNAKAQA